MLCRYILTVVTCTFVHINEKKMPETTRLKAATNIDVMIDYKLKEINERKRVQTHRKFHFFLFQ